MFPAFVEILYEDRDLVVVDKPSGLAVQPGAQVGRSAIELLRETRGPLLLVHRLDQGTSGVLVLAKRKDVAQALGAEWGSAIKRYAAIALGLELAPRTIDEALKDREGKPQSARTRIVHALPLPGVDPRASLVRVEIETGRMHQIRRHLQLVGHPVLLDDKYGDFPANRRFLKNAKAKGLKLTKKRLLLHAAEIELSGSVPLSVKSPLPEVFDEITRWGAVEAHNPRD